MIGKENLSVRGKIIVFKKNKSDEWEVAYEKSNLVVDSGLNFLVEKLNGDAISDMEFIAVGTDSTPESSSDTALGSELSRKVKDDTDKIGGTWRIETQFDPGEATGAWREAAIFNSVISGVMFNRVTINFVKAVDEAVRVRFEITFS